MCTAYKLLPRLILAIFLVVCVAQQVSAIQYQCTVLELPAGSKWGQAYGINDSGEVAGEVGVEGYGPRGVVWDGTSPTILTLPSGANSSQVRDINNAGQVAGMVSIDGEAQPVRWDNGNPVLLDLPPRPVQWGDIRAINSAGQIAGRQQNPGSYGQYEPVRWDGSTPVELHLGPYWGGDLRDINDFGNTVGSIYQSDRGWLPARWNDLDPTVLELPPVHTAPSGHAHAANNAGQIAGIVEQYPVRWDYGAPTVLDLPEGMWLGGDMWPVRDINDLGQVVGVAEDSYGNYPILWNDTEPLVLPLPDGYTRGVAYGINNSSQVVGTIWESGGQAQPARWDLVIPEPPTADAGPDQTVEQQSYVGTEVSLDGSGSSGPDDDIVSFEWCEAGDHLGSGEIMNYIFPLGEHIITLVVTDSFDETDDDEVVITVADTTPPDITINTPVDGAEYIAHHHNSITIDFSVSDICDAEPEIISADINGVAVENGQVVALRGGHKGIYSHHGVLTLSRGEYTLTVRAVDDSGNVGESISTFSVVKKGGKGKGKK